MKLPVRQNSQDIILLCPVHLVWSITILGKQLWFRCILKRSLSFSLTFSILVLSLVQYKPLTWLIGILFQKYGICLSLIFCWVEKVILLISLYTKWNQPENCPSKWTSFWWSSLLFCTILRELVALGTSGDMVVSLEYWENVELFFGFLIVYSSASLLYGKDDEMPVRISKKKNFVSHFFSSFSLEFLTQKKIMRRSSKFHNFTN